MHDAKIKEQTNNRQLKGGKARGVTYLHLYQKDNEAKLSTKGTPQDLAVKVVCIKPSF